MYIYIYIYIATSPFAPRASEASLPLRSVSIISILESSI